MSTFPVPLNEMNVEKDITPSDRTKLTDTTGITNHTVVMINKSDDSPVSTPEKTCDTSFMQNGVTPEDFKRSSRFMILLVCIGFLIIGRYSVPDEEISNIQDYVMDFLQFANTFINQPENEVYRNAFQILCSLLMDLTFAITFGYWVLKGTNVRLPLALGIFYVVRALVQKVWLSPFPEGFYWDDPGFPSLVVPYGRGSDFFFSGHSGFLVICACEWNKLKNTKVRNFIILATIYTVFILLTYRIHYSIDVFTGVFFAEWCFGKVDLYMESLEQVWRKVFGYVQGYFWSTKQSAKILTLNNEQPAQDQEQDQEAQP